MFSVIVSKLSMWKLNILSWRINFVVISRRNRRSFRLVEIRLYCQTYYMFLSSEKCLGITMSWVNCLHFSMPWCFSPHISMLFFGPGISISKFFGLRSWYRGIWVSTASFSFYCENRKTHTNFFNYIVEEYFNYPNLCNSYVHDVCKRELK